ncbi:MAG TPA: uridine kinase, partial [Atribacterota bacterium]|nr:uridine kinase [Atribacterota bacterium]
GIAGGTGCGKTTVAENICQGITGKKAIIIAQDSYYKDLFHLPLPERKKINFDHPSAFDNQLLLEHLNQLINGKSIQMPLYSFQNYTRKKITKKVEPAEVIILEGILVLEEKAIRNLLDIKIYVDTDSDERFIRRLIRDTSKRKRSLNSVVEQYLNRVKPMFLQFVEPSKRYADIIIPQGGLNKVAIDIITSKINAQLTQVNKS